MSDAAAVSTARLLIVLVVFVLGGGGLLFYRWENLQIKQHSHFSELARDNQIKLLPVEPPRGNIYDRKGFQITDNHNLFSLKMDSTFAEEVLGKLGNLTTIISIDSRAIAKLRTAAGSRVYQGEIVLRQRLNEDEIKRFVDWQFLFPEVILDTDLVRFYPEGDTAGHVIGYVGRINQGDVDALKDEGRYKDYRAAKFIGKTGIELIYEELLRGESGSQEAEVDAHGRIYGSKIIKPPVQGKDIYLTLDWALQRLAESLLREERGAAVLMDVRTGEVLVLASNPRFDGNQFISGISHANWNRLNTSEGKPLIHRAIYGQYAPGSVIKPFLALAALEHGWLAPDYTYQSVGFFKLSPRHIFHDWKKGGHGKVDIEKSIVRSVNSFYYQLGHDIGIDSMNEGLAVFGFGRAPLIDLDNEKPGVLPSSAWKRQTFGEQWYPGDTISSSVGQGYFQVTPLQITRAMAMLANGGTRLQPYLLKRSRDPEPATFDESHIDIIQEALRKVTLPGGTASTMGKGAIYGIAGKTGTAQVSRLQLDDKGNRIKNENLPKHLRDHAWFVGYAPAQAPEVAVAVIVENGGSGGKYAGPIARKILDAYIGDSYQPPSVTVQVETADEQI